YSTFFPVLCCATISPWARLLVPQHHLKSAVQLDVFPFRRNGAALWRRLQCHSRHPHHPMTTRIQPCISRGSACVVSAHVGSCACIRSRIGLPSHRRIHSARLPATSRTRSSWTPHRRFRSVATITHARTLLVHRLHTF